MFRKLLSLTTVLFLFTIFSFSVFAATHFSITSDLGVPIELSYEAGSSDTLSFNVANFDELRNEYRASFNGYKQTDSLIMEQSWINLDSTEFTVGPNSVENYTFTIDVPEDTASGLYYGIINVEQLADMESSSDISGVSFSKALGLKVLLTVLDEETLPDTELETIEPVVLEESDFKDDFILMIHDNLTIIFIFIIFLLFYKISILESQLAALKKKKNSRKKRK